MAIVFTSEPVAKNTTTKNLDLIKLLNVSYKKNQ